jgi:hypothetical protein
MKQIVWWIQNAVAGKVIEEAYDFGLQLGARTGMRLSERNLLEVLDSMPTKKFTADELRAALKANYEAELNKNL